MVAAAVMRRAGDMPGLGSLGKKGGRQPLLPGDSGKSSRSKKALIEGGSLGLQIVLGQQAARTSATVEWSGEVGPEESASSERRGTSGTSRLTLAASGAAMASRPPLTAEKCLRRVLISLMGAPEASSN